ncbi:hypothetical protein ACFOLJ_02510 [Rugamonas sp. CCM 8940]|uniref:hypothetical protein n=1 Tax=Rugamonas sp. CCM 8940 TaxID=2765359 RepID=UPI0018F3B462|nr:hypothetical protein [Rugamonas sp. CCM 8940]MBJ7311815.1 hypothetical protein [Rugamonas sp. CCM 8940]
MSISAIPSSSSAASSASVVPAAPTKQAEPPKQIDKPAERVAPPPAPTASTPSVNTSGQKIGTTISTSA